MPAIAHNVDAVVRAKMQQWPLHQNYFPINSFVLEDGGVSIKYVYKYQHKYKNQFGWTANVVTEDDKKVFYLLTIKLPKPMRGQGYGNALYQLIEDIAYELGCDEIRQTPSGWTTPDLKVTREDYLLRRGWVKRGTVEVYKCLPLLRQRRPHMAHAPIAGVYSGRF